MIDFLLDVWDWIIERFQDFHEILCSLPQVGPLFDEQPIIAYAIVLLTIGGFIYVKMSLKG